MQLHKNESIFTIFDFINVSFKCSLWFLVMSGGKNYVCISNNAYSHLVVNGFKRPVFLSCFTNFKNNVPTYENLCHIFTNLRNTRTWVAKSQISLRLKYNDPQIYRRFVTAKWFPLFNCNMAKEDCRKLANIFMSWHCTFKSKFYFCFIARILHLTLRLNPNAPGRRLVRFATVSVKFHDITAHTSASS